MLYHVPPTWPGLTFSAPLTRAGPQNSNTSHAQYPPPLLLLPRSNISQGHKRAAAPLASAGSFSLSCMIYIYSIWDTMQAFQTMPTTFS
jgi:hypothetical protein